MRVPTDGGESDALPAREGQEREQAARVQKRDRYHVGKEKLARQVTNVSGLPQGKEVK